MIYFNTILLIIAWYLYIDLRVKYRSLEQKTRNNYKSFELLEKAFDSHMKYIYAQFNKITKG
jgi:hypothetical protein